MGTNFIGEKLDNNLVGDSGEYLLCSKLCRMGISAGLMKEGIPYVDILATIDGSKTLAIQVKTSARRRNTYFNIKSDPIPSDNLIFVFIEWKDNENPIYFIVPSQYVHENKKETYINKKDISTFRENWKLITSFFWD